MSRYETQVVKKILDRAEVGLKKYGTTLERKDFTTKRWLEELQAELLDGSIYSERLIELFSYDVDIDTMISVVQIIQKVGIETVMNELNKFKD